MNVQVKEKWYLFSPPTFLRYCSSNFSGENIDLQIYVEKNIDINNLVQTVSITALFMSSLGIELKARNHGALTTLGRNNTRIRLCRKVQKHRD